MEGCGMKCIKYLLVVFNGLFLIFGIVIIATACVDLTMIKDFAGQDMTGHETDALLIAIGVLIIVIAAFGCFGAWKESPKLLYIFAGCLIIIILLELSVGIAAAALRPQIEGSMKKQLRASFIKNKSIREEDSYYRTFWDRIQSNMECCGINGPDNYGAQEPRVNPPYSCCPPDSSDRAEEIKRSDCLSGTNYYKEGCEDKVLTTIHSAGLTVIVCGILFCFLEKRFSRSPYYKEGCEDKVLTTIHSAVMTEIVCGILFCFLEVAGIVLALWLAHAIKTQGKSRETA